MTSDESTTTTTKALTEPVTGARADLLQTLRTHRALLLRTVQGLDDEQARRGTTVSELCLGGLVKHVTFGERQWTDFIVRGAAAMGGHDGRNEWAAGFVMTPDETLTDVVAAYEAVARSTDELVVSLPDLDASHLLPEAPWFAPGAS